MCDALSPMSKRRVPAGKLTSRLTGLDVLGFGASWEPATSDAVVAEGVIRYLEDRRVLYASADVEVPEHCIASVLDIRRELTDVLGNGGISPVLSDSLRAMRAACRVFLGRLRLNPNLHQFEIMHSYRDDRHRPIGLHDWVLNQAIGELRGVFGVHIALLASRYGVDVEEDLATILPPESDQ
ncbi:MAG: DUF6650 family protein [Acidimicrobiales bacterium]